MVKPRNRTTKEIICPSCGKTRSVSIYNLNRMKTMRCAYCTKKSGVKPKTGIYKTCPTCNKEFWVRRSLIKRKRYCSKICSSFIRSRMCKQCGKIFKPRYDEALYCSRQCFHKSAISRIEIICQTCGKKFTVIKSRPYTKFCSKKCQMSRPVNERPNFKHGRFTNKAKPYPYGSKWPTIRKWILERDNHTCRIINCNSHENLQVHHISRFDDRKDKDLQNHSDNLVTLCRKHHQNIHRPKTKARYRVIR